MSKKLTKKIRLGSSRLTRSVSGAFVRGPRSPASLLQKNNQTLTKSVVLYRCVYSSTFSLMVVFLLFSSLFLQSFYITHASEISEVEEVTETESVEENLLIEKKSEIEDLKEVVEMEDDENIDNSDISTEEISEEIEEVTAEESKENVEDLNLEEFEESFSTTSADVETEDLVDIVSENQLSEEIEEVIDNNEDQVLFEVGEDENKEQINKIATKEDLIESTSTTHESVSVVNSDSAFTFNKNECTQLASGSFYCHQVSQNQLADALFSAPDEDGDLEIFLVRDGKQFQITKNLTDDASPYFDNKSNTIVWHRSLNDRYQIISYDISEKKEVQLTFDSVNNTEPARQGNYTVWQRWINDSWNIVLHDGDSEIEITNDNDHNLSPHIQGSLVIWNKHKKTSEKTIEFYNIENGTYVTVNDPDGLTVDNPRMVLVYDSLHPNGDIVTKGFDILANEFIDLSTLPRNLPDIPDSESTTEVRALIQTKPEIEESQFLEEISDDFTDDVLDLSEPETVSASSTDDVLDLSEPEGVMADELTLDLSTTTEDVAEDISEENTDIPDLIIPAYEPEEVVLE